MALTPAQNEALIREVDDAVRQDTLMNFWEKRGRLVIGLIIAGLALFGGWLLWQNHSHNKADEAGEQLATVLKASQGAPLDQAAMDKLAASGLSAQATAAALVKAGLASARGDSKTAIADYAAIAADTRAPQAYRDLALLRGTTLQFDSLPPAKVIAALAPLNVPGKPFFASAAEVMAAAQIKAGQTPAAANIYAEISRDKAAPVNIRLRAAQMASTLGVPEERIGRIENMERPIAAQ